MSATERRVLVAVFAGYLHSFPRYDPHPRTYAEAAAALGDLTEAAVRRRVERLRERLSARDLFYAEGPNALRDLARWLIDNELLTPADLVLIEATRE